MKGNSEKLYDPCTLDVHFCHAKSLCDKYFPIVESSNSPFTSLWRVIPRPITFLLSQYVNQDHAALSVVHFKFSDLSECCKKFPPTQTHLALFKRSVNKYSSITCVATDNLTSGSSCSCSPNLVLLGLSSILAH